MNLTPSIIARLKQLLIAQAHYAHQIEGVNREISGLLGVKDIEETDDTLPLAVIGSGEFASVIEAKSRKEA